MLQDQCAGIGRRARPSHAIAAFQAWTRTSLRSREWLERGVTHGTEGFRLAQDPRTFSVGGAPFATLVASADARILLARGECDSMVSLEELRAHQAGARDIVGAGHNAHVEDPQAVVTLLEQVIAQT